MKFQIRTALVAGGFGGIATNLFDLATNLVEGSANWTDLPALGLNSLGFILLFVIGAMVVHLFEESDRRKAFIIGLSLPAFFAAATSGDFSRLTGGDGSKLNPKMNNSATVYFSPAVEKLLSPRMRQDQYIFIQNTQNRTILANSLRIAPSPNAPSGTPYGLWFFDRGGAVLDTYQIPDLSQSYEFVIPKNANKFGIWNDKVTPKTYRLPDTDGNPSTEIYLNFKRSYLNDFLRGLGATKYKPYNPDYSCAAC